MPVTTPARTDQQRLDALRSANRIRTARATWKRQVKAGEIDPLEVLADPPADFRSMVVFDVLMAMPKIGRTKATGVLRSKGVSPTKTLGGLTERQRSEVLGMVSYVRPVRRLQP